MEPNNEPDVPSKHHKVPGKAGKLGKGKKARYGLSTGTNNGIVADRIPEEATPRFRPVVPDCHDIDRVFVSVPTTPPGASHSCGYGRNGGYSCSHWNLTAGCQHLPLISIKVMVTICSTMCSAWTRRGCVGWMLDNSRGAAEYLCVLVAEDSAGQDALGMQPGCFVHSGVNSASGHTAPCPSGDDSNTLPGDLGTLNKGSQPTAPPPTAGEVHDSSTCADDFTKACSRWRDEGRCSVPWVQRRCPAACSMCGQSALPVAAALSTNSVGKSHKTKALTTSVGDVFRHVDRVYRGFDPSHTAPNPDRCLRDNTDSDNTHAGGARQSHANANLTAAAGIGELSSFPGLHHHLQQEIKL